MKRIHVFVLCCLMIACFCSGCFHAKDHTVIAQEIADTMIDAIRSRDAEAIEIMFSNSIQEELQNLPPEVCAHWYKKYVTDDRIFFRIINETKKSCAQITGNQFP